MNIELANSLRPVAEPRLLDGVYSDDQHRRLLEAVRREGPWQLILAQHFSSAEEVVATLSGGMPEGIKPTFDMFMTAAFRGYLAEHGTCLYPELEDCFYNSGFLAQARSYWNAKYAQPTMMLFNIQGPANSHDPAHLDGVNFRGLTHANSPIWLANTMGKSGLFKPYLKKMAQVITWFYPGKIGGGFTYWPEGPLAQPKRLAAPMWNRGVVVQNEMMYHRGEANGPLEMRHPQGLAFNSLFGADPDVADGWQITTDGKVIQRIPAQETRFLVHWSADVYEDFAELKKNMDHSDDLTHEQVFDTFVKDMRARGLKFDVPSDPLHDGDFIKLLNQTYDVGTPRIYPPEAPGPQQMQAA
ncbi:MAG TPA: hypothetical protein VLC91_11830 [Spongiibacteraceae bacterium]|nr:hypothetical protein [Spongiibacteraceae bacterium]